MGERDESAALVIGLRPAGQADAAEMLGFIRDYYAYDEIPFHETELGSGLEVLLSQPGLGRAVFIVSGDTAIGYAILTFGFDLEFGGRQGTVTDFYFKPEFRRRGLGWQAFRQLEQLALAAGMVSLQLQPERDNAEARAFYAKLGFREHDRACLSKRLEPSS